MPRTPTALAGKTTAVAPTDLALFHKNPRQGDVSAIASSLRRHTQYKPITANVGTHTGRPSEVLAGNHTLMAFRDLAAAEPDEPAWRKILVFWVDVDDDMAERIVVADNQTGQLGGFDEAQLAEIVGSFEGDIEGLGFTEADIADLNALLEERDDHIPPSGSPFDTPNDLSRPGQREDGLINQKDLTTRKDEYEDNAATRMVVLALPIARFIWVQEKLGLYRQENGVETNTDAVVKLLEAHYGEAAPVVEDAPAADDADPADPEGFGDDD